MTAGEKKIKEQAISDLDKGIIQCNENIVIFGNQVETQKQKKDSLILEKTILEVQLGITPTANLS